MMHERFEPAATLAHHAYDTAGKAAGQFGVGLLILASFCQLVRRRDDGDAFEMFSHALEYPFVGQPGNTSDNIDCVFSLDSFDNCILDVTTIEQDGHFAFAALVHFLPFPVGLDKLLIEIAGSFFGRHSLLHVGQYI